MYYVLQNKITELYKGRFGRPAFNTCPDLGLYNSDLYEVKQLPDLPGAQYIEPDPKTAATLLAEMKALVSVLPVETRAVVAPLIAQVVSAAQVDDIALMQHLIEFSEVAEPLLPIKQQIMDLFEVPNA